MPAKTPFLMTNSLGWPIRGDIFEPEKSPGGLVFVVHGFKGFKDWGHFPYVCERLAGAGFAVVSFNFSGSGIGGNLFEFTEIDKFKHNTLSLEVEDLLFVMENAPAIARLGGPGKPTAILGHSRGAVSAFVAASRRSDVGRVVSWAGVGQLALRYPPEVRAAWRERGSLEVVNSRTGQVLEIGLDALDDLEAHFEDLDPVHRVRMLQVPLLLIHGTADTSVPITEAEAVALASPTARLVPLEGAGHTFGAVHPFRGTTPDIERALELTLDFLNSEMG